MFKSEAKLFLSANNNVNSAKTLINECKQLIADFDLDNNSNCASLKDNINNCNIDELVSKIETTKESLIKLDQTFASEYMSLLQEYLQSQTIDTSNMTEEEQIQYSLKMNAYTRDYNYNLLYMLEKYEESDMLTDEMKQQLEYQRELVSQYDLQDKMSIMNSTSEEYIELFKKNADIDRKLINLDSSLTEEQKAQYLTAYETSYNQQLQVLQEARDYKLKNEQLEKELQDLYKEKEENSDFRHPFIEKELDEAILDKKIEIGKFNPNNPNAATKDDIDYKNMNGWDRFWTNTGTFLASTFTGLYNISEGIEDGFITLGSAVHIVDKDWATEFVSRDLSGELYQGIVLSTGMNTYSAYGTWHEKGEAFGEIAGHVGMTFAAPWASAVMRGFEAMGHQAETSFNNGDDYWIAVGKSFISGVGGAAEGYAYSKINISARKFLSSGGLKTVFKTTGTALTKGVPKIFKNNSLKEVGRDLLKFGKQSPKIIGHNLLNFGKQSVKILPYTFKVSMVSTLKDFDTWIETGGVLVNDVLECAVNNEWDVKKIVKNAGSVFLANYFMNFIFTSVSNISYYNTKNPHEDFKEMKPLDQFNKYNELINGGKNNSEALKCMLDDYEANFVPDWGKATFREKLEQGYKNLLKNGDTISWDDYLKIQLQILPYNPELQIPKTYKKWKDAIKSSDELCLFYKSGDVLNLTNGNVGAFNYGNGLGRAATDGYASALMTVPSIKCQLPDNWDLLTSQQRADWIADTVKLDRSEFSTGCYKIDVDKSLVSKSDIRYSTSQTLGSNGVWASTMTPLGSDVFEAVIPRIDDILTIDPQVQKKLNMAISSKNQIEMMRIFDDGLKDGTIIPKEGVKITHLY